MRYEFTIEPGFERLEGEWEDLAGRSGAAPFCQPGWISAWWTAFGTGELALLALRRRGALAGLIPLRRGNGRLSSPTNWHTPLYGPVVEDDRAAEELWERLFRLDVRSVDLAFVDAENGTTDLAADTARRAGRVVAARTLMSSPYVPLDGSWEDYERSLSRNRRKGIRRRMRSLQAQGEVSAEVRECGEGVDAALEELFEVEASGWKGKRGTAISSTPATRHFYTEVARWAAGRGTLRLAFLRLDGRPLACELALVDGGVWYSVKAGYEAAAGQFAPGVLLLRETLQRAFSSGLAQYDLLGPADDYKLGWARHSARRDWIRACARSPAGLAEAAVVQARERMRPLARRVRARVAP
ncbi:MAG: GNAT family N-acetyltransferase [Solirubrobacterales bacterium]